MGILWMKSIYARVVWTEFCCKSLNNVTKEHSSLKPVNIIQIIYFYSTSIKSKFNVYYRIKNRYSNH